MAARIWFEFFGWFVFFLASVGVVWTVHRVCVEIISFGLLIYEKFRHIVGYPMYGKSVVNVFGGVL